MYEKPVQVDWLKSVGRMRSYLHLLRMTGASVQCGANFTLKRTSKNRVAVVNQELAILKATVWIKLSDSDAPGGTYGFDTK